MTSLDASHVLEAEQALFDLLSPQVADMAHAIANRDPRYQIEMPEAYDIDLSIEDLLAKVAKASNVYNSLARNAGMSKALFKLSKGRFDRKYKRCRVGKNEADREANAMEQCHIEHTDMVVAEALADYADYLERASRVASETARKLLDKAQAMQISQSREAHGKYPDSDFSTY